MTRRNTYEKVQILIAFSSIQKCSSTYKNINNLYTHSYCFTGSDTSTANGIDVIKITATTIDGDKKTNTYSIKKG